MSDDLYREICRCPGDDTLRLAYADWLDENGDPDRAEFVRVQFGLHPLNELAEVIHPAALLGSSGMQRESLLASNHRLHAAHPEWSRLPCETCEGTGVIDQGCHCPTCHGTGDLFLTRDERAPGHVHGARAVTFARGFPDAVSCTLAEVGGDCPDCTGGRWLNGRDGCCRTCGDSRFIPTPWACEVVRRTPVTRFVLTDREPERSFAFVAWFRWYTGPEQNEISDELYHELEGEHPEDRFGPSKQPYWGTSSAAVDALALAAGRLVRRHVYGEVAA